MSTITKEQLRKRARQTVKALELAVPQSAFADLRAELEEELELARIALASLEAEPVYQVWDDGRWCDYEESLWREVYDEHSANMFRTVYTAPPVPVSVPDAISTRQVIAKMENHEPCDSINVAYKFGWNACRAAMLQEAK